MNNYQAIYYLNKQAKKISENRKILKTMLTENEDITDKDLLKLLDCKKETFQLYPWFPQENPTGGITYECYSDLNEDENEILKYKADDELQLNWDELFSDLSEQEIAELENSISCYDEYLEDLEKLRTELDLVQDNRKIIKEKLRELRSEQIKLYALKDLAIQTLNIPVVQIHIIDKEKYNYHEIVFDGVTYRYHTKYSGHEEINEEIEVTEIEYEPTLIDIDDATFEEAYNLVYKFLDENLEDFEELLDEKLNEADNKSSYGWNDSAGYEEEDYGYYEEEYYEEEKYDTW